ncbi:UDP-glucuronosyltransferase 1A3-like isoform X2 [Dromiciops gliroides]|uniref:UDP-glucuronosyltransferase 1A3-like isoform X2 n=1 Tax=Dromiciops gliroides TaxID=33562 RepID=UPI001CC5F40F|nr:UDP-glucuronosyltransferase 1A3-like isoform X2 [Dromiciops gliroides]
MATGLQPWPWALVRLALCAACLGFVQGGKLLVVPTDGSHWLSMHKVVQELSLRGHESVVLSPELSVRIKEAPFYTLKTFPVNFSKDLFEELTESEFQLTFDPQPLIKRFFNTVALFKRMNAMYFRFCADLVYNKELLKSLEEAHYDAILTDPIFPCGALVAQYLSIPAVYFLRGLPCHLDAESTQCPDPSSYIPRLATDNTDKMTFLQRVKNILYPLLHSVVCHMMYSPFASLASELLQRDVSIVDVFKHGSVWLMRTDFVMDFPKPIMPNMVFIGGINCASAKQLSQA